ncbi:helix-turn-helix domain-containing protein [Pseudaminobacter salicylatoxidans]|uniref:helix-turn-helix domain-containing protein n=1 Tax=Pseudaminobacter salicylatoxidans TaxID=93369 RepID=UPI000D6D0F8B
MVVTAKQVRQDRRWSQAELARHLGVAQSTVARIERGQKPSGPVARLLESLSAANRDSGRRADR